jgi:hypothetical protein
MRAAARHRVMVLWVANGQGRAPRIRQRVTGILWLVARLRRNGHSPNGK